MVKSQKAISKDFFKPALQSVNFPDIEEKILKRWESKGIVRKYLNKNNSSKRKFSFLDGPITANNPMGVHHGWGRTYKDLWQRYMNMKGYKERFQNGFDCQGLWVEVEVEKELGLKNKKEIENLVPGDTKASIAKFVNLCKERVVKYASVQTEQSERLGYFMDWSNSYFTMSEDNNYMIWHFLKVCFDNGWIYKGEDSVPWCPRCETAISQHEMLTEDYKEVVHKSVYMAFPLEESDEYLLVWTTTPWTIPANIAVAVDEKLEYSLVEINGLKRYWVAKDAVERVFEKDQKEIVKTALGKKLVGLSYRSVFDFLPAVSQVKKENPGNFHIVIPTDPMVMPITVTEGTGLVHTAVSAGAEDFKLGKKLGLPMIPVIDDTATYIDGLGFLSGQNAKKHPEIILDFMLEENKKEFSHWVYKVENYKHRYPACWRCKTELVWKVADEWYIAMDKPKPDTGKNKNMEKKTLRERMVDVAQKINWIPAFGLERELDWLNNMHDWLISKPNRYWGLALPIFVCEKCGEFEVIGSKEELKKRAVMGWQQFEGNTPHKPWIDEVKVSCSKCGGVASRIGDVGNPWLDAGIVAFSTIKERNVGEPLYLTDKDKWREWFPADFITESFPGQFKNWFYSLIAMSTVLENEPPFKNVLGFASLLGEDGRQMHKSWGNAIEFNEGAQKIGVDVMRWLFCRQNPAENLIFGYKIADETRRKFHLKLWNSYIFFVTYANLYGWTPQVKKTALKESVLDEWIVSRVNQTVKIVTESLDSYNAQRAALSIETLVDDISNWYIRRSRERVTSSETDGEKDVFFDTTYSVLVTLSKILSPFNPFITDYIYVDLTKAESVHLSDWPTQGEINEGLIEAMKNVRQVVEDVHAKRKEAKIPVRQPLKELVSEVPFAIPKTELQKILLDEVNIKKWTVKKGQTLINKLDTNITKELEEEAKTRELIRKIQEERKKLGTGRTDIISVKSPWLPEDKQLLNKIKKTTYAADVTLGDFEVLKNNSK